MKTIPYSDILKQAAVMTWKNKFLWLFGLIIFFGSIFSNLNMNVGSTTEKSGQFQAAKIFIQAHLATSFVIGLILVFVLISLFLLRFIAIAAIIKSANNIAVYSQSKIKAILYETKRYLWPLLVLEIMVNIIIFIIVVVLFIPVAYLFMLKANIFAAISFIVAFVIIVSVAIIAYYLKKYAYFYIVLGNMKIKMALENAYYLLRKNIRESLVMACLAVALSLAALAIAFIIMFIAAIIISPIGLVAYLMFAKIGAIVILIVGIIIEIIIFVLLFSIYASFFQVLWVLFFQEISLEKQEKPAALRIETETKIPTPEVAA
jgi:hypothetical protein